MNCGSAMNSLFVFEYPKVNIYIIVLFFVDVKLDLSHKRRVRVFENGVLWDVYETGRRE
jgi:hypothetical protein